MKNEKEKKKNEEQEKRKSLDRKRRKQSSGSYEFIGLNLFFTSTYIDKLKSQAVSILKLTANERSARKVMAQPNHCLEADTPSTSIKCNLTTNHIYTPYFSAK